MAIYQSGQRDVPAFAEHGFYEVVGLLTICKAEISGVPLELARNADRDCSQDEPFDVGPGNAEIGASLCASFARTNPIAAMSGVVAARAGAGRAGKERLGQLVFG